MGSALDALVQDQLQKPAPGGMHALAGAARQIHGDNVLAVIGYGSCLREGVSPDRISDLYLVLESYATMPDGWALRTGNRLLPPNVYYLEALHDGVTLRAKFATVTLEGFENWVSARKDNPYFWARFAQPCALLYARGEADAARIAHALATAAGTLLGNTLALMPARFTSRELWTAALQQTYRTEWRSEGKGRAGDIIANGEAYYARITSHVLTTLGPEIIHNEDGSFSHPPVTPEAASACRRAWRRRRITGRIYATLRLMKAAFTFQGGIDYLLWKIARHSGVQVTATEFQRRHPLLGAPALAWKVYRKGGFR